MGLLGNIAKAIGGVALESFIEAACDQFEQFVRGVGVGKKVNWTYDFKFKGKNLGTINIRVHKTRSNVNMTVAGQTLKIPLSGLREACIVAVHGAIAAV